MLLSALRTIRGACPVLRISTRCEMMPESAATCPNLTIVEGSWALGDAVSTASSKLSTATACVVRSVSEGMPSTTIVRASRIVP